AAEATELNTCPRNFSGPEGGLGECPSRNATSITCHPGYRTTMCECCRVCRPPLPVPIPDLRIPVRNQRPHDVEPLLDRVHAGGEVARHDELVRNHAAGRVAAALRIRKPDRDRATRAVADARGVPRAGEGGLVGGQRI